MNKQKRNYSNYRSKKAQINKRVKLQSIGNKLKNKIKWFIKRSRSPRKTGSFNS